MPLDRFVLVVIAVIAAAGATVVAGALLKGAILAPGLGLAALVPVALLGYVLVRVVAERLRNADDDRYDRIEK